MRSIGSILIIAEVFVSVYFAITGKLVENVQVVIWHTSIQLASQAKVIVMILTNRI